MIPHSDLNPTNSDCFGGETSKLPPGIWHLNRIQGLNNSWVCCIFLVSHNDDPLEMLGEYALNEYQGILGF